ncbi:MAG: alpha/beta hydrolase [Opitutales bacterium]|nr:alpha/beta hydrolase [Opitutales bacterium]
MRAFLFFFPIFLLHTAVWALGPNSREPDTQWVYKTVSGKDLKMDVFLPSDYSSEGKRFPSIVIFHGGSWAEGESNWHWPDCKYWSKRGMVAVSVDYRLKNRDQVQVPLECVKDAKSAIRFLRSSSDRLKIDPKRIVAMGDSAGGQLAAATATLSDPRTNDDVYNLSISCVPQVVVLTCPWFKTSPDLCPPKHLREGVPPFITFAGGSDTAISVAEMIEFHQALKKQNIVSELYIGNQGKHGFCNGRNPYNRFFYWSVDLTDRFLVKQGILNEASIPKLKQGFGATGKKLRILREAEYQSFL